MNRSNSRLTYYSLYFVAFAHSAGLITVTTLLPTYIDRLDPSGLEIGLFVSGLTFAQALAVIPLGWAGDRFDKRAILLGTLLACGGAYALFPFVETSAGFIGVRFLQGLSVVGVGLLGLSLVGELAGEGSRANLIGEYNAWRLAAGVIGTLAAGAIFSQFGFPVVFGVLVVLFVVAAIGIWRFVAPDRSTVAFAYGDLASNRRILMLSSFRFQYAFAVTLTRYWVPILVGVSASRGGLGFAALAVAVVIAAEQVTNMVCQPLAGRFSDLHGRAIFVLVGGGAYGAISLAFPFVPGLGDLIGVSWSVPVIGSVTGALLLAVGLNGLVGIADAFREPASMALFADEGTRQGGVASSFGIRNLVWQPGSVLAPLIGGPVMAIYGIEWVFVIAGLFALSGVATFAAILVLANGPRGVWEW